jgi:hypothetical protein
MAIPPDEHEGIRMIHINVRSNSSSQAHANECIVETSTDGAGWKVQYICGFTIGDDDMRPRREAENIARIMGAAWTYAGIDWRGTSHGYGL